MAKYKTFDEYMAGKEIPVCKFCSKLMAPAGGIVGTGTLYWKCWSCDYSLVFSHDALVGTEEVENDN